MSQPSTSARSVIVERDFPHAPEKVWQALTEKSLIQQWLMPNDFEPIANHRFRLTADWGSVDCQVLAIEPHRTLRYTWAAFGVETIVTWTLTPTEQGSHLRMEQSGFGPDQQQAYQGATYGWKKFIGSLERVVSGLA